MADVWVDGDVVAPVHRQPMIILTHCGCQTIVGDGWGLPTDFVVSDASAQMNRNAPADYEQDATESILELARPCGGYCNCNMTGPVVGLGRVMGLECFERIWRPNCGRLQSRGLPKRCGQW